MNLTSVKNSLRIPKLKLRQREAILFYLCISPWLIGFILFYLGPILASFYFSLTEWDLLTSPQFVGLENYVRLFTRDPLALKSFKVTLVYTLVYVPMDLVFGLSLALLLNQKLQRDRSIQNSLLLAIRSKRSRLCSDVDVDVQPPTWLDQHASFLRWHPGTPLAPGS